MDLTAGTRRLTVAMYHTTKAGEPKLLPTCTYPLTARACVSWVLANLALIRVAARGFVLKEFAPGVAPDAVRTTAAASFHLAEDVREREF